MRLKRLLPALLVALLLAGCGASASRTESSAPAAPVAPAAADGAAPEAAPAMGAATGGGSTDDAQPGNAPLPSQRLVIKTGTVTLEVESVPNAEASLRARAEQLGGYVVSVQTYGSDEYQTSTIVFRVPTASFEDALTGAEGLARKVLSRSVSGDDVTEEFVDLGSRQRNLEATRDRLIELLARAEDVDAALQVNLALSDVQGELEQIRGRLQYLQQSADFSTITADLQPVPPPPTIIDEGNWQPLRVAGEALRGLVDLGQGLVSLAIVFAVWTPVWLPLLLLLRWSWRRRPQINRSPKVTPPVPPAPPSA